MARRRGGRSRGGFEEAAILILSAMLQVHASPPPAHVNDSWPPAAEHDHLAIRELDSRYVEGPVGPSDQLDALGLDVLDRRVCERLLKRRRHRRAVLDAVWRASRWHIGWPIYRLQSFIWTAIPPARTAHSLASRVSSCTCFLLARLSSCTCSGRFWPQGVGRRAPPSCFGGASRLRRGLGVGLASVVPHRRRLRRRPARAPRVPAARAVVQASSSASLIALLLAVHRVISCREGCASGCFSPVTGLFTG